MLAGTGVVSLKIADKPWQKPFATIPLLFAVQQVTEGFLWLSIGKAEFDAIKNISMYTFLVFAHVVWPVWVPFSMWKMEKKPARKKILLIIMGMGATVSIYLGLCMMLYDVGVRIAGHHVLYILDYPTTFWPLHIIFYVAAIVVAPFVSSVRRMPFLAVVAFVSFAVAELLFRECNIGLVLFCCYYQRGGGVGGMETAKQAQARGFA